MKHLVSPSYKTTLFIPLLLCILEIYLLVPLRIVLSLQSNIIFSKVRTHRQYFLLKKSCRVPVIYCFWYFLKSHYMNPNFISNFRHYKSFVNSSNSTSSMKLKIFKYTGLRYEDFSEIVHENMELFNQLNPFQAATLFRGLVDCVQSRELGVRFSPSEVYRTGKLQWHFTCSFDFRHNLSLPFVTGFAVLKGLSIVPVGTMGHF